MAHYFDHERLDVYQAGRAFSRWLAELLTEVPRGHYESRDNLGRAAKSITRNIAEGAGKWSVADKVRFYHIARGSATECAAGLDELVDLAGLPEPRMLEGKQLLARVVAMLIRMIQSLDNRGSTMSDQPTA
jgi:four helix bundle protein